MTFNATDPTVQKMEQDQHGHYEMTVGTGKGNKQGGS
jgi:hypothetical protein